MGEKQLGKTSFQESGNKSNGLGKTPSQEVTFKLS
jgi:hypothetical protein